jgi:hypothetical protein
VWRWPVVSVKDVRVISVNNCGDGKIYWNGTDERIWSWVFGVEFNGSWLCGVGDNEEVFSSSNIPN